MKNLDIKFIFNEIARKHEGEKACVERLSKKEIIMVREFHKSVPQYNLTPLFSLNRLSEFLGVKRIMIKDESYRFGLNAFKVLGGSYAISKYLSEKLGFNDVNYERLRSAEVKSKIGEITFVTATDGNHGRGVAWTATQLGQKSLVYMPKGSSEKRLQSIINEGAEAYITEYNYDDAVRYAIKRAEEIGGVVVQDTAWEGYTNIPLWIIQGYCTLIDEAVEQIKEMGIERPTHVFLQAGVGSYAGAVLGYLVSLYGDERPFTVVVEPENAACIYESARCADGKPHAVKGDLSTIMAGLACGEPNPISWNILRDYADMYVSCPDYVSARGMRVLGNPLKGDPQIISGESGAVGLGLLSLILQRPQLKNMKDLLNLNENSVVLCISTEGDTDPENYRKIVWDGTFPLINFN